MSKFSIKPAQHYLLRNERRLQIVGYSSIGLILVIAALMLCPPTYTGLANAAENDTATRATASTISVGLGGDVTTGSSTVSGNGELSYGSTTLNVTTNNKTGYKLYLNSGNNRTTLKNESDTNVSQTINSLTQNTIGTSMAGNTWGYALSTEAINASSTFRALSTTSTEIDEQTTASTSGQTFRYNLGFGAHVDNALPAGNYTNTVLISVIANPLPPDISDITYMQEITSELCANTEEGYIKQLLDSRDNKSYWVAKMKDGNCWMTQNLALDITTAGLKAADTDITADWNSSSRYKPVDTEYAIQLSGSRVYGNETRSWNLSGEGKNQWILGAPINGKNCDNTTTDFSTCTKIGLVKVDNTWSPTFEAKEMVFNVPNTNYTGQTIYSAVDYDNKTYDAHYLIGNYYFWNTATAGTGGSITVADQNATGSICPKGWRLPSNSGDSTFETLLSAYGITSNASNSSDDTNAMPDPTSGIYNIAGAPLYFVRGGGIAISTNTSEFLSVIYNFAWQNHTWTSTSYKAGANSNYAYYLYFGSPNDVRPSNQYRQRYDGYTVRCVAR